jgi:hypothetical protein
LAPVHPEIDRVLAEELYWSVKEVLSQNPNFGSEIEELLNKAKKIKSKK